MTDFETKQQAYWTSPRQDGRRMATHPTVVCYVQGKLRYLQSRIDFGSSILDVGAGNGFFSLHLDAIAPTTAVDYSPVMLELNPVQRKQVMDARALAFPDGSFDTVFCHAVLHHLTPEGRLQTLREMRRVARRNVVVLEPNVWNPLMAAFGALKKEEHGLLRFTPRYLRSIAEQAGIDVAAVTPFGLLTPNRMPFSGMLLPLFERLERPWPIGICTMLTGRPSAPPRAG